MAVLIQKVIPADYAFVIHTTNPANMNSGELYAEVCKGHGESLVADWPGQGLSFSYNKLSKSPTITHYPNKSESLKIDGFIFRSDSNCEDLPNFAAAGLFDSFSMTGTVKNRLRYGEEKLFQDCNFIKSLIG